MSRKRPTACWRLQPLNHAVRCHRQPTSQKRSRSRSPQISSHLRLTVAVHARDLRPALPAEIRPRNSASTTRSLGRRPATVAALAHFTQTPQPARASDDLPWRKTMSPSVHCGSCYIVLRSSVFFSIPVPLSASFHPLMRSVRIPLPRYRISNACKRIFNSDIRWKVRTRFSWTTSSWIFVVVDVSLPTRTPSYM